MDNCYWFQLPLEIIDISVRVLSKLCIHATRLFSLPFFYPDTSTCTHRDTHICQRSPIVSLFLHFQRCAPVSLHWTLTRGGMMEPFTRAKHTHSFTDWAFSSALRRDRVVCLVVIGGIQPVQQGERAGETDRQRERERKRLRDVLFAFGYWKSKTKSKQQSMEVVLFHK